MKEIFMPGLVAYGYLPVSRQTRRYTPTMCRPCSWERDLRHQVERVLLYLDNALQDAQRAATRIRTPALKGTRASRLERPVNLRYSREQSPPSMAGQPITSATMRRRPRGRMT